MLDLDPRTAEAHLENFPLSGMLRAHSKLTGKDLLVRHPSSASYSVSNAFCHPAAHEEFPKNVWRDGVEEEGDPVSTWKALLS